MPEVRGYFHYTLRVMMNLGKNLAHQEHEKLKCLIEPAAIYY